MNPDSLTVKAGIPFWNSLAEQGRKKPSEAAVKDGGASGSDDRIYDGAFATMGDLAEALQDDAEEAAIVVYQPPIQAVFAMGKANPKPKEKKVKQGPKRAYSISAVNKKIREGKTSITKTQKRLDRLNRELDALAAEGVRAQDAGDGDTYEAMLAAYNLKEAEAARVSEKLAKLRRKLAPKVAAQDKVKALLKSVK